MTNKIEPAGKMFKYVSAERLADILESQRIRFTQPKSFNDPFEMPAFRAAEVRQASASLLNELTTATAAPIAQGTEILWKALTDPLSVTQVASRLPIDPWGIPRAILGGQSESPAAPEAVEVIRQEALNRLRELDTAYGILSLTGNAKNLLMWAHYAAEHRGAVIAIDIDHPGFCVEGAAGTRLEERRPITYQPKRPTFDPTTQVAMDQLFTKDLCWQDEKLYRIIRRLDAPNVHRETLKDGSERYFFPLPHPCVQGITFGCRFFQNDATTTKRVQDAVRLLPGTRLLQADMDPGAFQLCFSEISEDAIGVTKGGFELAPGTPARRRLRFRVSRRPCRHVEVATMLRRQVGGRYGSQTIGFASLQ